MLELVFAGLAAGGTLLTAGAVGLGALQLRTAKDELADVQEQATTGFEDDLTREYRSIVADLPAEAFYKDVELELDEKTRRAFYRYFDLSNEQLFLARLGRISTATDEQWRDGIQGNIELLPTFKAVGGGQRVAGLARQGRRGHGRSGHWRAAHATASLSR